MTFIGREVCVGKRVTIDKLYFTLYLKTLSVLSVRKVQSFL